MRWILGLLWNLLLGAWVALTAPLRLLRGARPADYVRFRLKGTLPYRPAKRRGLFQRTRKDPADITSLWQMNRALERLAADPRVKGVILVVDGFEGPSAKREALAALLARFRAAGKQVVGYATQAGNEAYALLCEADRIYLSAAARLDVRGFAAEATSLGGAFEAWGVRAQFVRRGEYKTAPELFTHRELSDVQRQTLETFLDERYRSLVQSLVQGRHLSEAEAVRAIDDAPLSARRALERRLCDGLVSESDLPRKLGSTPDASEDDSKTDARVVTYAEYLQSLRFPPRRWARFRRLPRLGVVPLSGMIVDGEGGGSPLGPKMTGAEGVKKAIARAARDRRTRALLLYVTSPGGSALGSELLLEEVKRAAKKKPVVAFFDQVAASGGYMAVLGAKEIWATPHAVAGSIGVFAGKFDLSGLLGKFGIHRTVITRGRNAGIYSSAKPFDESERRALEESVEDTYQAFLAHVAAARGMSVEEVHARGEGRVFSGTRALEQRLVDRLGGFEEAGARALELAGASARQFDVITYSPAMPRFAFLRALQSGASAGIYSLDLVTARADLSGHSDGL